MALTLSFGLARRGPRAGERCQPGSRGRCGPGAAAPVLPPSRILRDLGLFFLPFLPLCAMSGTEMQENLRKRESSPLSQKILCLYYTIRFKVILFLHLLAVISCFKIL